ncbi:sulfite exporter TauE/SafE family protein [Aneurinibacillus terranovensis]|uniref:sulfite exporter TauE/SafE family protein n=1 Tax=Aneurinibacillus terranovensis TaxID=278991 RepID=UPI000409466E|nr:sulfite exporter TauE/SafE family protein [Aneurinibacillus terranovensis]
MGFSLLVVMFLIGFIGSFFSGLLGIGGAIINFPLLLYVPEWVGVGQFTPKEVSSISMFQVFFASLAGVLSFRKQSKIGKTVVHKGLVTIMGVSILSGSLIGGLGSKFLPSDTINIVYGVLAVLAVIMMLIPSGGTKEDIDVKQVAFSKSIAGISAFLVGIISGIVGAGGAFILIPIMLTVLKIPTRITIASSLAIVFASAMGGIIGKLAAGHIPFWPTVFTVVGSLIGAALGSRVSGLLNVKFLRFSLAILISLTAIKIWISILG